MPSGGRGCSRWCSAVLGLMAQHHVTNQVWATTPIIPIQRKQRQEDNMFKVILGYIGYIYIIYQVSFTCTPSTRGI